MPRNQISIEEMKIFLEKTKIELWNESVDYCVDSKYLANKYLNKVLDKLEEYRY